MLGEDDKNRPPGGYRKTYLRSASWTERSPTNPNRSRPQTNTKARPCLPPLQPLSISRRNAEEWPKAGSDDLGVWPHPPTPGARIGSLIPLGNSDSEKPPREFEFKKDKLAFFDKECSRIADHIYLGSDAVAKNREVLRQNGITHVLNCVGFICPEYFKSDLVYKTLWLQDTPTEDITSILYDVFDYFEDVREQGGRVLVHCCQGVSRSTSLVIAYLMWREGQSFEDAFQKVKAARGVTNPNMGFACQLLQCQKRVHAVPVSPNSMLRMYRMAPHSPYDPLHLVPKMLNHPGAQSLDSRGAFIVHVPSAIYVWIGKNCIPVMSDTAKAAASQFIRYEGAQGSILPIKEGEEPHEFRNALTNLQLVADSCNKADFKEAEILSGRNGKAAVTSLGLNLRKVDEYDMDFEIFHKALAGGVVPPFPLSGSESETCLPVRENRWGRLRRMLASGIMKEFITASKLSCDNTQSSHGPNINVDAGRDVDFPTSPTVPLLSSSPQCGSPDSFSCFPVSSPDRTRETCKEMDCSVPLTHPLLPLTPPCGSPDSLPCCVCSPKFSSSPSASDYSSSFTFSPSSSNWSDISYISYQTSPSGLESSDMHPVKNTSLAEKVCVHCKGTSPLHSPTGAFSAEHALRVANTCFPCKGTSLSIAERRGSNPPPRMMLPSVDEASQVPRTLERSCSFSLPDLEDEMMTDGKCNQFEQEGFYELNREEQMLDADIFSAGNGFQSGIEDTKVLNSVGEATNLVLYQWPTMDKVEMNCFGILDSRSVYVILMPDLSLDTNNSNVLYIWLGRDISSDVVQSQLISSDDSHVHWEAVGRNLLNQIGLPSNSPVQIVREGEEPELLLEQLNYFSFQKA
ncbi:protein-tyrosine-phosphatase MKP1-like [Cornus florida]|uniref:protein-tyrosine-phosphatase MKP1-like n=1 Tax=Cornus florida TaxID=4283 RepID=UPI0028992E6A|nr:protein-tyrosine-phosphatase MKP1-like [Cornus florida]